MPDLRPEDFAAYFRAVHGAPPFPWQARLAREVAAEGRWPRLLDLPTGTGKTAAIDVALFHLALDAARPAAERTAPRRVVLVVDRRTVVDQAFERAQRIARALAAADGGVVGAVAARLRSLCDGDGDAPLAVAELRGGMPRDDGWARRPDQPLVAASTVDQVGSRLLFRGYGLGDAMRPVHAGLVGNDTLLLLDEVHLSEPFRQTLDAILALRRPPFGAEVALPDRFQAVEMSATPGRAGGFALGAEDRAEPALARRLQAKKPVTLEEVRVGGAEAARRATFVDACARHAERLAKPGRAVAVIVNRVATARAAAAVLHKRLGERAVVELVTGRMRPLDRADLERRVTPLVRAGRPREPGARAVVVVATQCIEAGADFDFDAVVSECATLDALRQRFGRLDRLGAAEGAEGVVLVRSDAINEGADDPIYGPALAATWGWLARAPRDFGSLAMGAALPADPDELSALLAPRDRAPVLLPAHLDAWCQTSPRPRPDPDVALWLHGVRPRGEPEVQIVWRDDVSEGALAAAQTDPDVLAALVARVEACPPVGLESLAVPAHAARAWLDGRDAVEVADVEGADASDDDTRDAPPRARPALLWRGDESRVVLGRDRALGAGATLVVPASYGGLADGTWAPESDARVADRGDEARWEQTGRPVARLVPAAPARYADAPVPSGGEDGDADDADALDAFLAERATRPEAPAWLVALAKPARKRPAIVRHAPITWTDGEGVEHVDPGYFAVLGRARVRDAARGEVSTEGDAGSLTSVEVPLAEHLEGVAAWARRFAESAGLPEAVARDVALAARWHDAGKLDPRFQRMLHQGSAYRAAVAREPLAKSALPAGDRAARDRAQALAGYPRGARHELASLALLEAAPELLAEAHDRDLVLHLVGSHHGHGRPFAPVAPDPAPVDLRLETPAGTAHASSDHGLARLDRGVPERFWRLTERYGWFGLAWLEALVRLADHRRSEEEQRRAAT
jgi:CRISPR-associated endonuclease/helicase Cas3